MTSRAAFPPPPAVHWLLAGIGLVLAPHALHQPLWLTLATVVMLGWRWAAAHGRLGLPGRWPLVLLAIASAVGILLQYRTLFGRDAGVAMLTLMLALKLLEVRSQRDAMLTVFLGYFVVITNFFYTQSIPVAIYLMLVVLVLTFALIAINHPPSAVQWRRPLKLSALLVVQAAPLMLLLFVLFPRVGGPLWGLPSDAFAGMTGLSDTMAPGSISRLVQSDAVAFRAEFLGDHASAPPPAAVRYWRGPVLEHFDGRAWTPASRLGPAPAIETEGAPVRYAVTVEPQNWNWIFALEVPDPMALPADTRLAPTLQLLAKQPIQRRTRYTLVSFPRHQVGRDADAAILRRALQLPASGNPEARALARRLRTEAANDADLVNRVLRLFHDENFVYTLTPPLLGRDGVDDFLFRTRRGFCEHYAGAFTFLMRAAGVPARVVTGYQGGEFNRVGNYLIVRQSDAHAWSEVWLAGQGWVRVDPTAAVAANRIEQGIASALPAGEPLPFLVRTDATWLKQLRLRWDAINNQWNQWVLGYNQERQIGLLASLGFGIVSWRELAWGLLIGVGLLLGIVAALTLRGARPPRGDEVHALYLKFCRKLARAGVPRLSTEGPLDFARRVGTLHPEWGAAVDDITRHYVALRYGAHGSSEGVRTLAARIATFRPR